MALGSERIHELDFYDFEIERLRNKHIFIYGAGGFGKEVYSFLTRNRICIEGFLDQRANDIEQYCCQTVYSLDDARIASVKGSATVLFAIVMDKTERHEVLKKLGTFGFAEILEAQYFRSLQVKPDNMNECRNMKDYLEKEKERINAAYMLFHDEKSKHIYNANIKGYFYRNYSECEKYEDKLSEQYMPEDVVLHKGYRRVIDCGGYIGDTVSLFCQQKKDQIEKIVSFEPDLNNYMKLANNIKKYNVEISTYPCAVSNRIFFSKFVEGTGSGLMSDAGTINVLAVTIDETLINFNPTFIKMDIEGEELKALHGARKTIEQSKPDLAICVYHNVNHMWDVPLLLNSWGLNYRYYLRNYNAYSMETVLYATYEEGTI